MDTQPVSAGAAIKIGAIESGRDDLTDMRYIPSLDALFALALDDLDDKAPGALSDNTRSGELRFLWRQGRPSSLHLCKITRPDVMARQWTGELRVAGEAVGSCTATLP